MLKFANPEIEVILEKDSFWKVPKNLKKGNNLKTQKKLGLILQKGPI